MNLSYQDVLDSTFQDLNPDILTESELNNSTKTMNPDFYYSSIKNQDNLDLISNLWTSHYNFLLSLNILEEWQRLSYEDAILSEKVFDV